MPEFACFLGSQPEYLVPSRLLRSQESEEPLVVNPEAWISGMGAVPAAIAGCYPLPKKFSRGAEQLWIRDAATHVQSPFWCEDAVLDAVKGLVSGTLCPQDLSARIRSQLLACGLLISTDHAKRAAQDHERCISLASSLFRERRYVAVEGLIHPFHVGALRKYYRRLLRIGGMTLGDSGSPGRFIAHNDEIGMFFHRQLVPIVGEIAGAVVKPSYVYVASYQGGASLREHTDRPQCEYSVTLLIDHTPEPLDVAPWPLYLRTPGGTVAVRQGLGDSLIYRGRALSHYRTNLAQGMTSTSIFFHYVDADFSDSLD